MGKTIMTQQQAGSQVERPKLEERSPELEIRLIRGLFFIYIS